MLTQNVVVKKKENVGLVVLLVALAVIVALGLLFASRLLFDTTPTVTLRASPVSSVVQMFGALTVDSPVLKQFPAGTTCTKLDGPMHVTISGIGMDFYQLDCQGVSGYVNARWVD